MKIFIETGRWNKRKLIELRRETITIDIFILVLLE